MDFVGKPQKIRLYSMYINNDRIIIIFVRFFHLRRSCVIYIIISLTNVSINVSIEDLTYYKESSLSAHEREICILVGILSDFFYDFQKIIITPFNVNIIHDVIYQHHIKIRVAYIGFRGIYTYISVSYTHLTLPTNREV